MYVALGDERGIQGLATVNSLEGVREKAVKKSLQDFDFSQGKQPASQLMRGHAKRSESNEIICWQYFLYSSRRRT